jgi:C-terminal processing protease CtpA/Prc
MSRHRANLKWNGSLMKLSLAVALLLLASLFVSPSASAIDVEFSEGSRIELQSLTPRQTDRLARLAKVWGFLKYHHPKVAAGEFHWDFELFRILPKVLESGDETAARTAVADWIEALGVPESCDPCAPEPERIHLSSPVVWIHDQSVFGERVSAQLEAIHTNRFAGAESFFVSMDSSFGNPVFTNEVAYRGQPPDDAGIRIVALLRVWNMIEYWFPYRDQLDDDWDEVLREFLPRFVAAADWNSYRLELLSLICRIGDFHANLQGARELRPPQGECYWPIDLRMIEGKPTVTYYTSAMKGLASGFLIGDVIESVEGAPVESLFETWSPFYCASNDARRNAEMARGLARGPCGDAEVTVQRQGRSQTITAARSVRYAPTPRPHDRDGDTFQLLTPDVAYLKLSSFDNAELDSYMRQVQGTRGLIIDIRNYPSDFAVYSLGSRLVDEPTDFARFTGGDVANPGVFSWMEPLSLAPSDEPYEGKVAILVDDGSFSQSEFTAMAFRSVPNAVVVGSTTAGADGDISPILLPGDLRMSISGIGVFYPDKKITQRIGIVPDIVIAPTLEGFLEGRDEVLDAAMRHVLGSDIDDEGP